MTVTVRRRLAAALLDRDGTINVKAPEGDYVTAPGQLELLPGAGAAIRRLNRAGVPVVVITNQRGIALGRMDETDLAAVHERLGELLDGHGAHLDAILHCPHDRDVCGCRKPGPLMALRAGTLLGLDTLRDAVMIGDSPSDVEAGRRAGARTVRLGGPGTKAPPGTRVAPDLAAAVRRELSAATAARAAAAVGPGNGCG